MLAVGRGSMLRGAVRYLVLDELVVGDNISDRVSPTVVGARSRQCLKAVQHGCWRARRLRELNAR